MADLIDEEWVYVAHDDEPNSPIGTGRGSWPGRVVWVYNPAATKWDGVSNYYWNSQFTDQKEVSRMLDQALCGYSGVGTGNIKSSWDQLFHYFNRTHHGVDDGYQPGEKIAIKVNLNNSLTYEFKNYQSVAPQVLRRLLDHLVNIVGVDQKDITVYDASRLVPTAIFDAPGVVGCRVPVAVDDLCIHCDGLLSNLSSEGSHAAFPGVAFVDNAGNNGRTAVQADSAVKFSFSDPKVPDAKAIRLPTCVTGCRYLINMALLRGHSDLFSGVTFCGKNLMGSFWRPGAKDWNGWRPDNLHNFVLTTNPMASYNPIVDLIGHSHLGGKTLLYLVDGLYGALEQNVSPPFRWTSTPFCNAKGWTASLFASMDPVAIDSVCYDFCAAEPKLENEVVGGTVDGFLHEAALLPDPPSGVFYDPDGLGKGLDSLGVHEHWDSPSSKKYSRNLGKGVGIELVTVDMSVAGQQGEAGLCGRAVNVKMYCQDTIHRFSCASRPAFQHIVHKLTALDEDGKSYELSYRSHTGQEVHLHRSWDWSDMVDLSSIGQGVARIWLCRR